MSNNEQQRQCTRRDENQDDQHRPMANSIAFDDRQRLDVLANQLLQSQRLSHGNTTAFSDRFGTNNNALAMSLQNPMNRLLAAQMVSPRLQPENQLHQMLSQVHPSMFRQPSATPGSQPSWPYFQLDSTGSRPSLPFTDPTTSSVPVNLFPIVPTHPMQNENQSRLNAQGTSTSESCFPAQRIPHVANIPAAAFTETGQNALLLESLKLTRNANERLTLAKVGTEGHPGGELRIPTEIRTQTKGCQPNKSSGEPFPVKLHRLLIEVEDEGQADIISFSEDGTAFRIHKPEKFFSDILPNYFNASRLSSFKRQLNLYGFQMKTSGPDKGAYYHENFIKSRPEMFKLLTRRDVKFDSRAPRRSKKAPIAPDFYSMPPINPSNQTTKPNDRKLSPDRKEG